MAYPDNTATPNPRQRPRLVSTVWAWIRRRRPDPQQALLDALTPEEVLDIVGPSWAAMSPAKRASYPSEPTDEASADAA